MKRVLKIACGTWENASRDKRELSVCRDLGMETIVMAKGQPGDSFREDEVDGFPVFRFSTRPLGAARFLNPLNRVLSLFIWGRKARKFHADIITGHNLAGLFIGYLSNLCNCHKAKLVYDSHEFEIGLNDTRSPIQIWAVKHLERFLIKRCVFSIMVNDSIADAIQQLHHLEKRPVVAWNAPSYWNLDPTETAQIRQQFLSQLNMPEETFLVMFHGGLAPTRGLENLLRALAQTPDVAVVILGNPNRPSYLESLQTLCGNLGITDRVLFQPAVPHEKLRNYASAADVGVCIGVGSFASMLYTLPNKFFENIQSMTPLIANDYVEIGKIMRKYGIGVLLDPKSADPPADIAAAIRRMRDDREFYTACKENLKRAKEDLCWERGQAALKQAYAALM